MEHRIQLIHPDGKKAVSIDSGKYQILRNSIIQHLKSKGESTHEEILQTITENFRKNHIKFEGSVEWYLEWVKLDLEAKNEIKRMSSKSPVKFNISE